MADSAKPGSRAKMGSVVKWVKVSDLKIGAKYQRAIREQKVKAIAENFDPFQFGVPAVAQRDDGSLHVTDGQHRITALRKMGWDDQMIQVEVISELPYEQEAGMHVDRNANRTATSALDRFWGNLEAQRPVQVAIKKLCDARGLSIAPVYNSRDPGMINAVSTLEKLYEKNGEKLLATTLDACMGAWGTAKDAFDSTVLKAVAKTVEEYDRLLDMDRLVRSMKRSRPMDYRKRAEAGKELNRANTVNNMVVAIVADYNNLPGGRKLPPATELTSRSTGGRTYRVKPVDRAMMVELFQNGYSKAEVKERMPHVTKSGVDRIYKDAKATGQLKAKKRRAGKKAS